MIDEEHDRRITSFTNSKKKREREKRIIDIKFKHGVVSSICRVHLDKF